MVSVENGSFQSGNQGAFHSLISREVTQFDLLLLKFHYLSIKIKILEIRSPQLTSEGFAVQECAPEHGHPPQLAGRVEES